MLTTYIIREVRGGVMCYYNNLFLILKIVRVNNGSDEPNLTVKRLFG
jgi:hypothetical protein